MTPSRPNRGRLVLIATFLVFFLPVVGAWLLNVLAPHWHPFGQVNHGTLVEPPLRVSTGDLRAADGRPVEPDTFTGHWTLVHLQASPCAEPCRARLTLTRQARLALGENSARVRRILVQPPGSPPPQLTTEDADLRMLQAPPSWPDAAGGSSGPQQHSQLLIVDPQGFLILSYPRNTTRKALLADLERLLKISKIG